MNRTSGINSNTPEEFLLGAGVVFKNFKYIYSKCESSTTGALEVIEDTETETDSTIRISSITSPGVSFIGTAASYTPVVGDYVTGDWDDSEKNVLGATKGGNKLTVTSELMDIEVDGASVKVKGLTVKTGENAKLETNIAQHNIESIKRAIVGKEEKSLINGYDMIVTKPLLELSDYLDNIAYVGWRTDGKPVIAILENAICTSGYETDNKNKDTSVVSAVFEASADFKTGVYNTLPVYIFCPKEEA